jgi:uncharacterized membrane protein
MDEDSPVKFILAVATALLALTVVSPFLVQAGSLVALDGSPGYVDHMDLWSSIDPVAGFVYLMGDVFCHQDAARTSFLNGNEMAICIRDLGVLVGLVAGMIGVLKWERLLAIRSRSIVPGVMLMVPLFVDWTLQFATSANFWPTRLLTGMLFGIGAALIARSFFDSVFLEAAVEKKRGGKSWSLDACLS